MSDTGVRDRSAQNACMAFQRPMRGRPAARADFTTWAIGYARFIHAIESCSTVAIDTQTKYGTWAAATQR